MDSGFSMVLERRSGGRGNEDELFFELLAVWVEINRVKVRLEWTYGLYIVCKKFRNYGMNTKL